MNLQAKVASAETQPASIPFTVDVDRFWRDGFLIIRGAFPAEEIEKYRAWVKESGRNPDMDLLADPVLRNLLLDPRIVETARQILGGQPVYYGDSNVWHGQTVRPGFHKDCADKDDLRAPDWQGRYSLIRFGIYAQDHSRNPDGLDLRRGSHDACDLTTGKHVYANTAVGDIVVWNMRTSHSGGALMLKLGRRALNPASILARFLRKFPMGLLAPAASERIAFFLSYGLAGSHVERYVQYLRTRNYSVQGWRVSAYDADALALAEARGVDVINMHEQIKLDPPTPREEHRPLPY